MAKNLKLKIKNTQLAAAVSLTGLQEKLGKKKEEEPTKAKAKPGTSSSTASAARSKAKAKPAEPKPANPAEAATRVRARSRSVFSEGTPVPTEKSESSPSQEDLLETAPITETGESPGTEPLAVAQEEVVEIAAQTEAVTIRPEVTPSLEEAPQAAEAETIKASSVPAAKPAAATYTAPKPVFRKPELRPRRSFMPEAGTAPVEKLGPTGRHIRDLLPPPPPPRAPYPSRPAQQKPDAAGKTAGDSLSNRPRAKDGATSAVTKTDEGDEAKKGLRQPRFKEYQDLKPAKRTDGPRVFDARDRQGLRDTDEEQSWRRRRGKVQRQVLEPVTIRPTQLTVRLPITIKDLAAEMKLKASQLIEKLFLQGTLHTINDFLDDETTVQLLGHELGCEIAIDTKEEERIRITGKSVREEVLQADSAELQPRPPVVAFMGHVDHGKTSLIDAIRKSNRVAGEAGAITQHIGAFQCHTAVGDITVLDTPGHEAFSAMRARGTDVTDIVVLVVAGDEGIRQQTIEAIQHAKAANVTIVVAINKSDKPNFNAEAIYRQLSEQELLPEVWGGQTITVNCSAVTGEGISTLLEMLALQSEVLELKANPKARARGRVLESEMHKGMGAIATVLVQNGTLHRGDALVFDQHWGRVKTMRDDHGQNIEEATAARPVEITGLSGLPEAGQEFIVVSSEREAREIADKRMLGFQQTRLQQGKRLSMESLVQQAGESDKKILNLVLLADVQGSLEALQVSLKKIVSDKVMIHIISKGVGEVSESDVQLAMASKAVVLGFHAGIESHAESLIKETGVQVRLHDIIYHAVDDVKALMVELLDKIAIETEKGKAEVLEVFKSSQLGSIAGCRVIEGSILRSHPIRVKRGEQVLWKGSLASLKRVKEDVREVQKGMECGMVLQGFKDVQVGDILESYEVTHIQQQL